MPEAEAAADVDRIDPLPIPADPDPGPALAALDQAIALTEARLDQLRAARARVDALLSVRLQPALPGIFSKRTRVTIDGEIGDREDVEGAVRAEIGQVLAGDPGDDLPPDEPPATVEPEAPAAESQADPPEGEGSAPAPDTSTEPPPDPPPASPRAVRRARKRGERQEHDDRVRERRAKIREALAGGPLNQGELAGRIGMSSTRLKRFMEKMDDVAAEPLDPGNPRRGVLWRLREEAAPAPPPAPEPIEPDAVDEAILAALAERPQTLAGLAVKLHLRQDEAGSRLARLARGARVERFQRSGTAQPMFRVPG